MLNSNGMLQLRQKENKGATKMENNNFLLLTKDDQLYMDANQAFVEENFFLHRTTTAAKTVTKLHRHNFTAIIWDIRATTLETCMGTMEVIRQIMQGPIICLVDEITDKNKIRLFKVHVDDVLDLDTKPQIFLEILKQRVWAYQQIFDMKAYTIHKQKNTGKIVKIDNMVINYDQYSLKIAGQKIDLTPKEFKLLAYFYENKNQVLSREQILNGVWHYDIAGTSRMVDIHVSHLRDKIEPNPKKPQYLKTVRGFGYMFVTEN